MEDGNIIVLVVNYITSSIERACMTYQEDQESVESTEIYIKRNSSTRYDDED